MSTQEIIDSHDWKSFISKDSVSTDKEYFRSKLCGVIVFNTRNEPHSLSFYYVLSDYNQDYNPHLKMYCYGIGQINVTCNELIIKSIIE